MSEWSLTPQNWHMQRNILEIQYRPCHGVEMSLKKAWTPCLSECLYYDLSGPPKQGLHSIPKWVELVKVWSNSTWEKNILFHYITWSFFVINTHDFYKDISKEKRGQENSRKEERGKEKEEREQREK